MKKIFTLLALFVAFTYTASAQLADGSIAPDWTLTDINGNEHHLYEYLDNGYSVVIDFSATWCGPCWGYHTSGALEELYINHGPAGMSGVSDNTTDDVMVFFIEGDESTTSDDLNGTGSNTQGNWVEGTPYPIIDDGSMDSAYEIAYWPTIYTVCPDRTITESSQITTDQHYAITNSCGFAQYATDIRLTSLNSSLSFCGDEYVPELTIQNLSTETVITSATITVSQNGTQLASYDWTGSLETYDTDNVTLPAITGFNNTDPVVFEVTVDNDMDTSNNSFSGVIVAPATSTMITVEILTDSYANETSWDIRDGNGTTIETGSGYANNSLNTVDVYLTDVDCYEFNIYDAYGDGICCSYGEGYYSLKDENGVEIAHGGEFTDTVKETFHNDVAAVSVDEINAVASLNVYPNPMSETANVLFNLSENLNTKIEVVNMLGEVVFTENLGTLSYGKHNVSIDFSELTSGVYFLNVISEGNVSSQKITISK